MEPAKAEVRRTRNLLNLCIQSLDRGDFHTTLVLRRLLGTCYFSVRPLHIA